jgi:hypothetical protein
MSDELLKRYAGAGAEGAGYATEEETVVAEGLEDGAPEVLAEDVERWGTSPEAAAAYADLAHHGGEEAAPEADTETPEGETEPTGLGARVRKLFGS